MSGTYEDPAAGTGAGAPDVPGREILFRLVWDGGVQPVGEPMRPGTGKARLEMTPTQMIRLTQELSPAGIQALMLVIENGYRPGRRTEIVGWGSPWLREHGMGKAAAERAARELTQGGYVRSERLPGQDNPLGRKLGVVPGGLFEAVEDVPGVPRTDGRPSRRDLKVVRDNVGDEIPGDVSSQVSAVSHVPGIGDSGVVDNTVSQNPGNGPSQDPRIGDDKKVIPQVEPVSRDLGTGSSTGPSRRLEKEKVLVFSGAGSESMHRSFVVPFLTQPTLRAGLHQNWETSVAALARIFVVQSPRCQSVLRFMGEEDHEHPATRVAAMVVDLLRADGSARLDAAHHLSVTLKSRTVRFQAVPPDEVIATVVMAIVSSLAVDVRSMPAWFAKAFSENSWIPSTVVTSSLRVLSSVAAGEPVEADTFKPQPGVTGAGPAAPSAPVEDRVPSRPALDEDYVARLRAAVEGTSFDDEISFRTLLGNPGMQQFILERSALKAKNQAARDQSGA